jgi:rhodanese-related sulfurtransferase
MSKKYSHLMLILLVAFVVALTGCGGDQAVAVPEEAAPLAEEAVVVVEEALVEEQVVEEAAFDLVASVDAYMSSIPEGYMGIKLDGLKQLMDSGDALVIDVREVAEYEEGHIPGAINIPLRTLAQNLDQIPANQPVVVYCKSGHRAGIAVSALHMLGYDNSRAFGASYNGWTDAGEPVETDLVAAETYPVPEIEPELMAAVDGFLSGIPEGFLAMGDIEKFNEAIDNGAFLVDVREVAEYTEGYIPGAVNIPIRTLAQNLDQIPSDQPVFVYCKSGHRAAVSIAALQTMGLTNVRSFPPGFSGWSSAGQPVAAAQ